MTERERPPEYYEKAEKPTTSRQRSMDNGRIKPFPILDTSPPPSGEEIKRAVENFEIYWRNCTPMTEVRNREGLPIVTREDLETKRDEARKPYQHKPT